MKAIVKIVFLMLAGCGLTFANPITFTWTGNNPYSNPPLPTSAFFTFSGGTIANGVFTPTGLINSTWGLPGLFQPIFYTDSSFGPAFQIDGIIQPVASERIFSNDIFFTIFNGQTETIHVFDTSPQEIFNLPGTWSVTGLDVPEAANSGWLLLSAMGALGAYHIVKSEPFDFQSISDPFVTK